ncbi:MAG: glycosyltransferase [Lachnospiraceae bacterium]|nr:glycosyltransferase [Lachnospiraceae bacterium]
MKFSIITPTWNQAAYIEDTITSVLNQTHKDLELIIVDNLSTDGTKEIIERYAKKDSRIIYIRERDYGQAEAINKGFDRADGDIVCWLNSSDFYVDEEVLEKVNSRFAENKKYQVVVGDAWYCNKNKELTEYKSSDKAKRKWVLRRWYYIMQSAVFWKKNEKRLEEAYHYVFDWKFFGELLKELPSNEICFSNEAYAVYRMYEDNKTGLDNAKRKKEIFELQRRWKDSIPNIRWCHHVWRVYDAAEELAKRGQDEKARKMKKRVQFMNKVLFHVTGKRICSF